MMTKKEGLVATYGKLITKEEQEYDKHLKNKDEALLYLIKRLEETENELNDLKEINLSLRNETISQEIKLSEVRDFIKKHRRTIDDYYIYDPADSQELKELSDVIY